jgi:hypothetical protein
MSKKGTSPEGRGREEENKGVSKWGEGEEDSGGEGGAEKKENRGTGIGDT